MKRRKTPRAILVATLAALDTSGVTDAVRLEEWDSVVILANFTTVTAGSITLVPQLSPDDGTTWYPVYGGAGATAYSSGALGVAGARAIQIPGPLGVLFRVAFTIATGPITGTIQLALVKGGGTA